MVDKKGGFRRKSRTKLTKGLRSKGKLSITRFLQEFEINNKVCLKLDSSYHKGVFHPRFYGSRGTITGKKGKCYIVQIQDGGVNKTLIVHPIHLKKIE